MAKPRIGLLGVGRIGIMHARILAPKVESLVVADVVPERARQAADELGARVRSVEDFFDSDDLDGVVLATPTDAHARHIEAAVRLSVPIFCEKPVALDIASTERANAAAKSAGVPVHIGFQRRFDAAYAAARERLAAGKIGELRRVHMHTLDQAPAAREFLAASGGIFTDCLIHDFDALRWVTGREVEEVFAFGTDLGLPDFADFSDVCETVLALRLTGGALATAHSSRFNGAGYDVRMEVHGTEGTDVVGMDERLPVRSLEPGVAYPSGEPWVDFIARFADCYERELEAFLDVVAGKGEVPSTIDDAVASLRVAEACAASCREGRPVKVAR
ncbi:MAG: inositol 2-dehydrogenase [Actinomyces sp.]|nr:MAG: inositol 2-dehydrogenase [Actinomyces sp.]